MDDLARSSWNLIPRATRRRSPVISGDPSGAYGPSTERSILGIHSSGPSEEANATSSVEDRTGSARAPGEEEPPALELPNVKPLVFRVATPNGAPTRKTNSGDPRGVHRGRPPCWGLGPKSSKKN